MPQLIAGKTYTVTITVRNGSSRAGSSVAARLTTEVQAFVSDLDVIPFSSRSDDYAADQARTFSYAMPIAENMAGYSGQIQAIVKSPSGNIIANRNMAFSVVAPTPPPPLPPPPPPPPPPTRVSFLFGLTKVPAGWTEWQPRHNLEGVPGWTELAPYPFWIPVSQNAAGQDLLTPGYLSFWLQVPSTGQQAFYGLFGPIDIAEGDIWIYDFATNRLEKWN